MKQILTTDLISKLESDTRKIILQLNYLRQEDPELLNTQPYPGKWSIAQVLDHLNSYGRYYLPEINRMMNLSSAAPGKTYVPGLLGAWFTKSMLPKEGMVRNKMKAMRGHIPDDSTDSKQAIDEFEEQHRFLLKLLEKANNKNLEKIRIPISISTFIRLKLGDTFTFFIAHEQRHFVQIENTIKSLKREQQVS